MSKMFSVTTTSPKAPASKTGMQPGEIGCATPADSKIAAWLAARKPNQVDKAAVSRASQFNVALELVYEGRFPTGPNGERLPSYEVLRGCQVSGSQTDREMVLADFVNFMTPAPEAEIEGWLAELSTLVLKRRDDVEEGLLRLRAYTTRLQNYPADVARSAVLDKPGKFWPSWAELEEKCERLVAPRRAMLAALQNEHCSEAEDRARPTKAERARMQKLVEKAFPKLKPMGSKTR